MALRYPPGVRFAVLDAPPLVEDHVQRLGLRFAVGIPGKGNWRGAFVFESTDAGTTYNALAPVQGEAYFGQAVTQLQGGVSGVFLDTVNTVRIEFESDRYQLESAPAEEVARGLKNWGVVGQEVIGFETATLVATNTYELSNLLRGRRGTEWAIDSHQAAGEEFVLLTKPSATAFVELGYPPFQTIRFYKGVTAGAPETDAAREVSRLIEGASLRPWAPVLHDGVRNAAEDLTISWTRRSRSLFRLLSAVKAPPDCCGDGEADVKYEVDIWDDGDHTTLLRTIEVTGTSTTYTAAQQTTDFGAAQPVIDVTVYQMNPALGRGIGRDGAI